MKNFIYKTMGLVCVIPIMLVGALIYILFVQED